MPYANSCMFVFPSSTAPARRSFRVTVASASGTKSRKIFEPAVVRTPRVQILSLSAMGMPCSGPRQCPRSNSLSAARAAGSALSAVTLRNAFKRGLNSAMRDRHSRASSTGDIFLLATSGESSSMVANAN